MNHTHPQHGQRELGKPLRSGRKLLGLAGIIFCLLLTVAHASAAEKILRVLLTTPEGVLDPAVATDVTTVSLNENIFEAPLSYEYLARPLKLQANTAQAMPEISADGKTYILRFRSGIHFTPDPVFQGRPRELTAADYAYSLRRLYDPSLKSPWLFMFEGKLVGDEKWRAKQFVNGKKFANAPDIAGIQVLDRYTLQLRLNAPDSNFLYILATNAVSALAREVVEQYGSDVGNHPVGTGPYRLSEWQRSYRLVLQANPDYRRVVFAETAAPGDTLKQAIATDLAGKTLPRIQQIRISIVEEPQTRVLSFLEGQFDYLEQVPPLLSDMVMKQGKLLPRVQQQGIRLALFPTLQTYYMWMNMEDPVIGGYTAEKIALRRAIALSYDSQQDIELSEKGLALAAQSPLPPNVLGYDAGFRSPLRHDLVLANALLDHFGYTRAADHYRRLPDGRPLELLMHTQASTTGRLRDEVWRKNFSALGLRVRFKSDKMSEILRAARLGKVQMTEANWIADFPDGENFYQLLYGGNIGRANYAHFNLPAFNQRYEQAAKMSDTPERRELYRQMALLVHGYNPWVLRLHPLSADLTQPWLKNYLRHPVNFTAWRYLELDPVTVPPPTASTTR
ncbi:MULTISPECIES: ABC transporter substrate-binding protein [unclassified Undibacterium]|uniref:ABC transporter substrate-binding protein n=1 Tax=unclassified Undibacterium TaxID=2630295 RepID=UPI002AC8B162|nr:MULTISPECIES: ABC transporter substrate-binding protein [unclassified Undibacterium]MEB0140265.1 ABC transporter substrate-binding protein [Undibacterium sp. CCC2.1]MEB0173321.1 ABC transporter substrate-binding protein [Undibacterium sp. CCC1.1]MEB0177140.1 ABC transporter substrate-binding protein [Undibacterium sp. CCC3.4]MEB0216404.1 ABC transporter substrate-binding protein [Undibacterium sp. 5I2]WPX45541.1 ABC transporter substrate-binding protein [Undibacterium sp. CCC3.4]